MNKLQALILAMALSSVAVAQVETGRQRSRQGSLRDRQASG